MLEVLSGTLCFQRHWAGVGSEAPGQGAQHGGADAGSAGRTHADSFQLLACTGGLIHLYIKMIVKGIITTGCVGGQEGTTSLHTKRGEAQREGCLEEP